MTTVTHWPPNSKMEKTTEVKAVWPWNCYVVEREAPAPAWCGNWSEIEKVMCVHEQIQSSRVPKIFYILRQ